MLLRMIAGLALMAAVPLTGQTTKSQEKPVTTVARGTFEVKMGKLPSDEIADAALIGRMSIDKEFHGDIEGTSKGQMLATSTAVAGSAGYVALERVTGTLAGRKGSFSLQHSAWMAGGKTGLTITVVPDSGTEELAGIQGSFVIIIEGKKHSYEFSYSFAGR